MYEISLRVGVRFVAKLHFLVRFENGRSVLRFGRNLEAHRAHVTDNPTVPIVYPNSNNNAKFENKSAVGVVNYDRAYGNPWFIRFGQTVNEYGTR